MRSNWGCNFHLFYFEMIEVRRKLDPGKFVLVMLLLLCKMSSEDSSVSKIKLTHVEKWCYQQIEEDYGWSSSHCSSLTICCYESSQRSLKVPERGCWREHKLLRHNLQVDRDYMITSRWKFNWLLWQSCSLNSSCLQLLPLSKT